MRVLTFGYGAINGPLILNIETQHEPIPLLAEFHRNAGLMFTESRHDSDRIWFSERRLLVRESSK